MRNWRKRNSPTAFAEVVRRGRLTQVAAAAFRGIDQPKVTALLSGRLTEFSSERLVHLLARLGQDVEIAVKSKPRRRQRGRIRTLLKKFVRDSYSLVPRPRNSSSPSSMPASSLGETCPKSRRMRRLSIDRR